MQILYSLRTGFVVLLLTGGSSVAQPQQQQSPQTQSAPQPAGMLTGTARDSFVIGLIRSCLPKAVERSEGAINDRQAGVICTCIAERSATELSAGDLGDAASALSRGDKLQGNTATVMSALTKTCERLGLEVR